MAKLVNNGAGATFSTAANWDTITNTPTIAVSYATNITIANSSYYSEAFTAPNTTNYSTGVIVYVHGNNSTAGTVTAYLQENSAGWVDKANSGAIQVNSLSRYGWYYFRFSTPYKFTATTASYYRIKVTGSSINGTTTFGANTAGTNFAYLHSDDRHVAPAIATDDIWICGANGNPATITVDGTANGVGTGASTGFNSDSIYWTVDQVGQSRYVTNAVNIGEDGTLNWDNVASSTLTVKGNIHIYPEGHWIMDGSADQTKVLKLVMDLTGCTTGTGGYGILKMREGTSTLTGAPKSSTSLWQTTIASGVGTAANPVIMTDAVNWVVGDEISIPASSNRATNYQEGETRFIITKNSATSYVWSATLGGLESGITAAYHTLETAALNTTRNVVITTTNSASATLIGTWYYSYSIDKAKETWNWVRWENIGSATSSTGGVPIQGKDGMTIGTQPDNAFTGNYVVIKNVLFKAICGINSTIPGYDMTGMIIFDSPSNTGAGGLVAIGGKNQTYTDCWIVNCRNGAWYSVNQSSIFTRCHIIGTDWDDLYNKGGFVDFNGVNNVYQSCESHCNRKAGITSWGVTYNKYNDCILGTKGANFVNILPNASGILTGYAYFHRALFSRTITDKASYLDDITLTNYMLAGSEIAFDDHQGVLGAGYWFKREGIARTTTTNARTASSKCVEISPVDTTNGFTYDFLILARANTAVQALGFVKKHSVAAASVCTVKLFLPGSTTPDFTQTMPDDANWNPFVVYGNYTGAVDKFARVEINIKAASGLFLIDDIFNGTNNITGLDASFEAKPSPVMFEQLGDAAAVWAVPTATLTTAGTTGKKLVDDLTTSKFIGLQ